MFFVRGWIAGFCLLGLVGLASPAVAGPKKLSVADLVLLKRVGFSEAEILAALRKTKQLGRFALTVEQALKLRRAGFRVAFLRALRRLPKARATPRTANPRTATPRTATPRTANPRRANPQRVVPRRAAPQRALPRGYRRVSRFFFTVAVPTGWKPLHSPRRSVLAFRAQLQSGRKKVAVDIKIGGFLGRPKDLKGALGGWMRHHFFPGSVSAAYRRRLSPRQRRKRKYWSRHLVKTRAQWRTQGGAVGSTAFLGIFYRRSFRARLGGYILHLKGRTLCIAASLPHPRRRYRAYRGIKQRYVQLLSRVFPVAIRHTSMSPLRDVARWGSYLKKKRSYSYFFQFSYSYGFGNNYRSFLKTRSIRWRFYPDGTCKRTRKGFAGSFMNFSTQGGGYGGQSTATSNSRLGGQRRRCYVQQTAGALWLIWRQPHGLAEGYLFEPNKRGKYGPFKLQGLAIDGRIEGRYYKGGSGASQYRVYRKAR